jgi:hypothetical protein
MHEIFITQCRLVKTDLGFFTLHHSAIFTVQFKKTRAEQERGKKINITAELSNEHFHFLTTFVHFQLKIITVFSDLNTTCKPIHCYYKF